MLRCPEAFFFANSLSRREAIPLRFGSASLALREIARIAVSFFPWYAFVMSEPQLLTETLDDLLDHVVFADPDPRIQRMKGVWEEAKSKAKELHTLADRTNYESRLDYYRICHTTNPEECARSDASLLRIMLDEECEARMATIWKDITRRVSAILEDLKDERESDVAVPTQSNV